MKLSPSTLTRADQMALLETVQDRPREALVVSLALGTGLRLAEIVGLDVGDVYLPGGQPRVRVRLRAEIAKRGRVGDVFLPDGLKPKLVRFWAWKLERRERVDAAAPLLCSQTRRRISKRRVQVLFRELQVQAGFDRLYPFHALRHTAITNVYRASKAELAATGWRSRSFHQVRLVRAESVRPMPTINRAIHTAYSGNQVDHQSSANNSAAGFLKTNIPKALMRRVVRSPIEPV